jgi:hypothetical protein
MMNNFMQIVKEMYSPRKNYKAEISRRDDGMFQVTVHRWEDEWEFWTQRSRGLSLTDSLHSATDIALEDLRNLSGEECKTDIE